MNKKSIAGYLTTGIMLSFVFASTASAFWPFDALFNKGEVKAVVTDKMYREDVNPKGSKALMTYQTLVSMNDSCRRLFSRDYPTPTRPKITPSARDTINSKKMSADATANANNTYLMEFGIENSSERELTSIYNNLKARCDNIANLTTRMQKIYKGGTKPTPMPTEFTTPTPVEVSIAPTAPPDIKNMNCGGIRGTICPSGYTCSYRTATNKLGKVTPDAMGTCVIEETGTSRDKYFR